MSISSTYLEISSTLSRPNINTIVCFLHFYEISLFSTAKRKDFRCFCYSIIYTIISTIQSSQKFHSYDSNKVLFIVTLIVCVSVLCVLIGLIAVFFVKRRDYLRQKLIENVSNLKPNKGKFDDIERLVTDQSTGNKLKNKVWPFKTKQVSTQQAVSDF